MKDFNLTSEAAILGFIGAGGLENPKSFINTKEWENNPDKHNPIMVDAWSFCSGLVHGYLAFFFQPKTKKWTIKSLKKNDEPDPRNLALKGLQSFLNPIGEKNEK